MYDRYWVKNWCGVSLALSPTHTLNITHCEAPLPCHQLLSQPFLLAKYVINHQMDFSDTRSNYWLYMVVAEFFTLQTASAKGPCKHLRCSMRCLTKTVGLVPRLDGVHGKCPDV